MTMRRLCLAALLLALPCIALPVATESFDHGYADYAQVLARHVQRSGVAYAALKADRGALDRVVAQFDAPEARGGWLPPRGRPTPPAPTRARGRGPPPPAATWRARKAFVSTATRCACPASSSGTEKTSLPTTVRSCLGRGRLWNGRSWASSSGL